MDWLYVPGLEVSSSESSSPCLDIARSVTWRGKHSAPPVWSRRWNKTPWLRRLSGMTLEPSTAQRGVDSWISSLRDSRASRGVTPASDKEQTTRDGSGQTLREPFAMYNPDTSSWRTSQGSFLEADLNSSSVTWPKRGTMRNGMSYQRRKSARPISASASSSWRTPDAGLQGYYHGVPALREAAKQWGTPSVADTTGGHANRGGDRQDELLLVGQAKSWATPSAHDGRRPGPETGSTQGRNLKREAESFHQGPTETGADGRVLNPAFVEVLMGFPPGLTSFGRLEMESWRSRQRTHLNYLLGGQG